MLDFHIASREEKLAAFSAVYDLWPHADDPEVHLLKRFHSVQHARAEWFVGTKNGKLITSCGAYPLTLFGPDGERCARGFGAVYTNADHRGQGHAAQLLQFVMEYYRTSHVDNFILFSDISPLYYERLGFQLLPSWECTITAEALPKSSPWTLQKELVKAEDPGPVSCKFGIKRNSDDNIWTLAKQNFPLRKTRFSNHSEGTSYWLVSYRKGQAYYLLESNIPEDFEHWALFRTLVAADAAKAKCRVAKGWWASKPSEPNDFPHLSPRKDGILMWRSRLGSEDPWFGKIQNESFRTFLSEQF